MCGDYKCTVNQVSKLDSYPIPKTKDLLANLRGGEKFTKLDHRKPGLTCILPLPAPALTKIAKDGSKSTRCILIAVNYCRFFAFNVFLPIKIGITVKNIHV